MMRGQAGDRAEMGQGRGRVPVMNGRDVPCFRRGCIVDANVTVLQGSAGGYRDFKMMQPIWPRPFRELARYANRVPSKMSTACMFHLEKVLHL